MVFYRRKPRTEKWNKTSLISVFRNADSAWKAIIYIVNLDIFNYTLASKENICFNNDSYFKACLFNVA